MLFLAVPIHKHYIRLERLAMDKSLAYVVFFVSDEKAIQVRASPWQAFSPSLIFGTGNTKRGSINVPLTCLTGLN